MWILVITTIQVYYEKRASRTKEKKFNKTMISRKFKNGAKACAERDDKVKERPDPH